MPVSLRREVDDGGLRCKCKLGGATPRGAQTKWTDADNVQLGVLGQLKEGEACILHVGMYRARRDESRRSGKKESRRRSDV